ncbi:MAG: NosD domain-containing protein [Methanoregula sp.]|jgi:parallel beta-helix repeat protein|uniref:protein kinase domain-containing protein n=1 Tax=Methanoregula sp. TaxID=2052170 RepID=UPI003C1EF5B9
MNKKIIQTTGISFMMRHTSLVLFCCAAVLLMSAACVPPATGAQYTVAPSGGGFTSIQDAVTWASPLDTITVWSGTYPGTVKIDKKITLIGVDTGGGSPVIDPGKRGTALEIAADGCTIKGFVIQNSVTASGILISSNGNTIENNTLEGNAVGIQLASANDNSITGNAVTDSSRAGIVLRNAKNNLIEGNRITKNTLGISLDEQSTADTITYNIFSNTENVLSKGTGLQWESPSVLSYVYLGRTFTGRLGNYWSDYQGIDENSDGIGDTPYAVGSGLNRNPEAAANQNEVDPAPLMDPIEYYSQIRPAASGMDITPIPGSTEITASSGQGVPQENAGSAASGDRAGRSPVVLFVLVLLVCIVGAGGVLFIRSRKKRSEYFPAIPISTGETHPRPVHDPHKQEEEQGNIPRHPDPGTQSTIPAQETEVVPTPMETPPATGPKFYFPPELESRYVDIRHVGRGGVAHVFAAHRTSDHRLVAVKIPISFDEVTGKCFLNEITAWQKLRHKNIVEVLEVNILPVPYVEMEYVPGSLEAVAKPLPVWKAVHLVHGIADGLAYAHAHGIIHRDIKPHNILVTGDFVPKITDWGMSKVIATTMEKSSVAGFSLSYAAPEQVSPAEFGRTDIRTDIYQIGALFYELVTGSIPFGGESIVEVGNAIVRDDPIPPTEYNPDAEAVEKIILKCLAKNPADRYQSAADLLDALSRYLDEDER